MNTITKKPAIYSAIILMEAAELKTLTAELLCQLTSDDPSEQYWGHLKVKELVDIGMEKLDESQKQMEKQTRAIFRKRNK